jgi:hypothetical protein
MPQSTGVHASTQDNSAGTLVAQATSEVSGSGTLQTTVAEGNKSTYSEVSRTGITTADTPVGGDLTTGTFGSSGLIDCGNAINLALRATCSSASATLSGRVVLYDGSSNPIGYSEAVNFAADATLRLGNGTGDFVSQRVLVDVASARKVKFLVTAVSGGTWAVYARPI